VKHGIEYFSESFANFPKYFFQVVAGWNYKVQYSIKTTNCSKAELPLLTPECQAIPEGREGICTITAYVHFTNELVKSFDLNNICGGFFLTADEIVPAPVCVGCPVSISIHNPELQEPLAAALEKYNSESQNDFHYAIVQITKATSQVGTFLLHLYFNFVQTQCSVGCLMYSSPLSPSGSSRLIQRKESHPYSCTHKGRYSTYSFMIDLQQLGK
uniref:Cystatin domain-containing protein n=1 Tax=Varanus komodoensis TaxID=61221 RepID=A0A8D2L7N9_VARKO